MGVVMVSVEQGPPLSCLQGLRGGSDLAPKGGQLRGRIVEIRALASQRGRSFTGTDNYNNSAGYDDPSSCSN